MTLHEQIDLNKARIPPDSEFLSGRDCGEEFRRKFQVDRLDATPGEVKILIPDAIVSMNTSFFLGLFGPSVRKLGKENFSKKYKFVADNVHLATVAEGIERALKEATIFSDKSA